MTSPCCCHLTRCIGGDHGECRALLPVVREVIAAEEQQEHKRRLWALLAQATKSPRRRFVENPLTGHMIELRPGERWEPFRRMEPWMDEERPVVLGPEPAPPAEQQR